MNGLWVTALSGAWFLAGAVDAQVVTPPGWRWATDRPAQHSLEWNLPDSSWRFVQMPPGWHITTRPAALMYEPSAKAEGRYSVESVQILFPGTAQSGYGFFLGGRGLETSDPHYVAFLVRRDGHAMVERRAGAFTDVVVPWTAVSAIRRVQGDSTASNTLRVSVDGDSVRFDVNGSRAIAVARGDASYDGHFGFRTGADLNMHVTTLDYTRRFAPVPARKAGS